MSLKLLNLNDRNAYANKNINIPMPPLPNKQDHHNGSLSLAGNAVFYLPGKVFFDQYSLNLPNDKSSRFDALPCH